VLTGHKISGIKFVLLDGELFPWIVRMLFISICLCEKSTYLVIESIDLWLLEHSQNISDYGCCSFSLIGDVSYVAQSFYLVVIVVVAMTSPSGTAYMCPEEMRNSTRLLYSPGTHLWCQPNHRSNACVLLPILGRAIVNVQLSRPHHYMYNVDWLIGSCGAESVEPQLVDCSLYLSWKTRSPLNPV